jgi:sterol desaturase/sphingolipid hydroxylase (fatty acid hydroxylase superfamily)
VEPAVADFRAEYRASTSAGYRGGLHGLLLFLMGSAGLSAALYGWGVPGLDELPLILANLLLANFAIYFIHRDLGHRLRSFARLFYQRHSKEHHRFFSPSAVSWEEASDLRVVFFPLPLLLVVGLAAGSVGWGVQALGARSAQASALFCTTLGYYLAYELIHFCDHLPEGHALTRVPGLRYMRAHHRAHHDPEKMHKMNFNIVFPFADIVFRSLIPRSELSFEQHDAR